MIKKENERLSEKITKAERKIEILNDIIAKKVLNIMLEEKRNVLISKHPDSGSSFFCLKKDNIVFFFDLIEIESFKVETFTLEIRVNNEIYSSVITRDDITEEVWELAKRVHKIVEKEIRLREKNKILKNSIELNKIIDNLIEK